MLKAGCCVEEVAYWFVVGFGGGIGQFMTQFGFGPRREAGGVPG